ncbi:hypothetical protein Tco_1125037 [Tanacetum coccineum]|uniref:Uncharacterized protein n=1 Tax=Tanacetum coccineum TaxID=301880 RepID=A0ABQ5J7U3_9ASTR
MVETLIDQGVGSTNIRFLENTPNVKGNEPDWLFDVDSLSISMNYVPVAARKKTIGIAGTKDNIVTGLKDYEGDAGMKPTEVDENEALDKSRKHDQEARSESERLNQKEMQTEHTNSSNDINIVSTPVSTVGPSFDIVVPSTLVNTVGPSVSTDNESEEKLFDDFLLSKMHLPFHLFQIYLQWIILASLEMLMMMKMWKKRLI